MKDFEQALQNLHIAESEKEYGTVWHSLRPDEIDQITQVFVSAGFRPPENQRDMQLDELIYHRFQKLFAAYVGTAKDTNQFDAAVYARILELAREACNV